jgi:hypothetical protein
MKAILLSFLISLSLFGEGRIVLVHGFMNQRSMNTFNRLLKKNGWEVTNWKYPSRDKTINEHAHDLVTKLGEIPEDGKPTHLIGFSLGGLIIKAALNNPDCPEHVKQGKVVLISSPLQGSKLARTLGKFNLMKRFFGNHAGRELYETPDGGFDKLGSFPKDTQLLIISGTFGFNPVFSGKNDGKVAIHESCPATAHSHKFIPAGHSLICRNLDTFNLALTFLEDKEPLLSCPLKQ